MRILYLVPLLLSIAILTACSEPDDLTLIQQKIEKGILDRANDPDSYSFHSIEVADTVYFGKRIEFLLESNKDDLERNQEGLEENKELAEMFQGNPPESIDQLTELYEENIREAQASIDQLDSLKEANPELLDQTAFLIVNFTHRESNSMGALERFTHRYHVRLSEDRNVVIIWGENEAEIQAAREIYINSDAESDIYEQLMDGNGYQYINEKLGID